MSKFIEQLNDYSSLKLIPRSITLHYRKKYEETKKDKMTNKNFFIFL